MCVWIYTQRCEDRFARSQIVRMLPMKLAHNKGLHTRCVGVCIIIRSADVAERIKQETGRDIKGEPL